MKALKSILRTQLVGCFKMVLVSALTILPLTAAHAVAFNSDVSIAGSTDFEGAFSFGPTSGNFDIISGGTTTTSTYADSTVTGSDPLVGSLTDIGDGFGISGTASATDDEFAIGFDTALSITNSSATDTYEVVFDLRFLNSVNADGQDAFADSELTLDIGVTEVFFSDLISDTFFGDMDGGASTGTFGNALSDAGTASFTLALNPGDLITMDLIWTLEGGDFAGGLAEAELSAFLSVASVTNTTKPSAVPEPGTLLLLCMGLLGLGAARGRSLTAV